MLNEQNRMTECKAYGIDGYESRVFHGEYMRA